MRFSVAQFRKILLSDHLPQTVHLALRTNNLNKVISLHLQPKDLRCCDIGDNKNSGQKVIVSGSGGICCQFARPLPIGVLIQSAFHAIKKKNHAFYLHILRGHIPSTSENQMR